MERQIWFDMDGTIADLYGVDNWLEKLANEDATPYEQAKPLINMQALARVLNGLIEKGYTVNIISWLSKKGSDNYKKQVARAKTEWLQKHLKSVGFTKIDIVPYGTPKQLNRDGILFDDEKHNRDNWLGTAYNVDNILGVLKGLK